MDNKLLLSSKPKSAMTQKEALMHARQIALGVIWRELSNPSEILPDEYTDDLDKIYIELENLYYKLSSRWVK